MRIALYGWKVIVAAGGVSAAAAGLVLLAGSGWWAALGLVPLLFTVYFFRDPRRTPPEGAHLVLAPADGRVTDVEQVEKPDFVGEPCWRIAIFLSIFDVHLNRAPTTGTVKYVKHRPGRFLNALRKESATENERNSIGMDTGEHGRILVDQIAGVIARRIVCSVEPGSEVKGGERIGMIMFGSRTDLYLPCRTFKATVKTGEKVHAGTTVVGEVLR